MMLSTVSGSFAAVAGRAASWASTPTASAATASAAVDATQNRRMNV
jgi:hypothetical protein